MRNITINAKANTIEMTKKFADSAKRFGTEAYKELQMARKDYPDFRVVIKEVATKKESYKGLTFKYMETYIKAHDDEKGSILAEFKNLRAESEEAKEMMAESLSYGEIKKWFFEQYPAIKAFHENRAKMLEKKSA